MRAAALLALAVAVAAVGPAAGLGGAATVGPAAVPAAPADGAGADDADADVDAGPLATVLSAALADADLDPPRLHARAAAVSVPVPLPLPVSVPVAASVAPAARSLLATAVDAAGGDGPLDLRFPGDLERTPLVPAPLVAGYLRPGSGDGDEDGDGDADPLAHDTRAALVEAIREAPGRSVAAAGRAVGVPRSTARHHVRVLERAGVVVAERVDGRHRLFPADEEAPALAAALRRDGASDLLATLADDGPGSTTALAERVDRAPATVSHHLSRLQAEGLVERERDGRRRVARLAGPATVLEAPDEAYAADD